MKWLWKKASDREGSSTGDSFYCEASFQRQNVNHLCSLTLPSVPFRFVAHSYRLKHAYTSAWNKQGVNLPQLRLVIATSCICLPSPVFAEEKKKTMFLWLTAGKQCWVAFNQTPEIPELFFSAEYTKWQLTLELANSLKVFTGIFLTLGVLRNDIRERSPGAD